MDKIFFDFEMIKNIVPFEQGYYKSFQCGALLSFVLPLNLDEQGLKREIGRNLSGKRNAICGHKPVFFFQYYFIVNGILK